MRKFVFIIILSLSCCFLVGCRAKLDTSSSTCRRQTDVIGLELRKLDSLWRSSSERQTLKIEFYEPNSLDCFVPLNPPAPLCKGGSAKRQNDIPEVRQSLCCLQGSEEAAPSTTLPAALTGPGTDVPVGGGMGAVKSIEITTVKEEEAAAITATDSTYNNIQVDQETREASTATEARQDNGTVIGVAIVLAVAALIYLTFKSYLK